MTTPWITPEAVQSLRPDVHTFPPEDLLQDALIITSTTKVGVVAGDQPTVRCPFIDVDDVDFVPEGDEIPLAPVDSREAVIHTGALAVVTLVSVDQYGQPGVSDLMANELRKAMTQKADAALISQEAPDPPDVTPPGGLLAQEHESGGTVTDDLDAVVDAIAAIQRDGGTADVIVASPESWATVSKLKTAEDSNESLLGPAGVAAERVLLSVPVVVNAAMPTDKLLVFEKRSVLSAYGQLELANSEHSNFRRRAIETRLWWRIGAVIARPERVVELTVGGA